MAAMNEHPFPEHADSLWIDCNLATMLGEEGYGTIKYGAMAVKDGKISWIGPASSLPRDFHSRAEEVHHLGNAWITPGLVDCHTHLVYAGNRAGEFEKRLQGTRYEEIAKSGGGILSTVRAVRAASEEDLYKQSIPRIRAMQTEGTTTIEIKSGYGLNTESELKMLKVIGRLDHDFPVTVCPTFLGAHTLPPEYSDDPEGYIDLVVDEMLPAVASQGLATAVDAFCERIGFTSKQTERVFAAAVKYGLRVKLHAEQLSDQKGAILAARYNALSVDHLEYLDKKDVSVLADSGTTAVLLPGAFYFLRDTQKPPVHLLKDAGVPMAVSTDCNPGSSPCTSPLLMMNMACTLFGLTPAEALRGMTTNAARALGLHEKMGSLEPGKKADFAVWEISEPAEIAYRMGGNPCRFIAKEGMVVIRN
jgi:imidazolonepropionase